MTRGAGLVRGRAVAQRMLLAAAVGVMLPALVLMTLIRMHAAVAERDAVRHALGAIPDDQRVVSVHDSVDGIWGASDRAKVQSDTDAQIAAAFTGVPTRVLRSATSAQYGIDHAATPSAV